MSREEGNVGHRWKVQEVKTHRDTEWTDCVVGDITSNGRQGPGI